MISFIVPAHNEERWIGKCLASIRTAMESFDEPHEVIVVDDASTDSTLRIAMNQLTPTSKGMMRKRSSDWDPFVWLGITAFLVQS